MKDWDPSGKQGPKMPLPDVVTIHQPKVTSLDGKACINGHLVCLAPIGCCWHK